MVLRHFVGEGSGEDFPYKAGEKFHEKSPALRGRRIGRNFPKRQGRGLETQNFDLKERAGTFLMAL